jgi:hypothetical protein
VLSRPVHPADVRIKPTGQIYLSHPTYTLWLNQAFGRMGWKLVPAAKPVISTVGSRCQVQQYYWLMIHGKRAAIASGEQEYFADGKEQTPGDALEATYASALRRTVKHLGVGLELWDKVWCFEYVRDHCVLVAVTNKEKKRVYQWRRKADPPLPYEITGSVADGQQRDEWEHRDDMPRAAAKQLAAPAPSASPNRSSGRTITEPQGYRLKRIIENSGRIESVVREWLVGSYGVKDAKFLDMRMGDYDAACAAIAGPDPLPAVVG